MPTDRMLPDGPLLTAFLIASLVLAITPGPGVLYIVTRSVSQGRAAGFASVAGVALGNLGNALGAALGLAALFSVSALAFTIVKFAGAAYLVYLGIQALRAQAPAAAEPAYLAQQPARIVRDGFLVGLFNPKTALFFAAFLPQFMDRDGAAPVQSVTLGTIFVALAALTDTLYVFTASAIRPLLSRAAGVRAVGRYLSGAVFIGLGVLAASGGPRSAQ